jgi:hypothetical protein
LVFVLQIHTVQRGIVAAVQPTVQQADHVFLLQIQLQVRWFVFGFTDRQQQHFKLPHKWWLLKKQNSAKGFHKMEWYESLTTRKKENGVSDIQRSKDTSS